MLHDLIVIVPQKTIAADAKALKWAADPYAVIFLETIAELIRINAWQEKQLPPLTPSPLVTAENR